MMNYGAAETPKTHSTIPTHSTSLLLLLLPPNRLVCSPFNTVCHSRLTNISGSSQTPTSSHPDLPPTGSNAPYPFQYSYLHLCDLNGPCLYHCLYRCCSYHHVCRSCHCVPCLFQSCQNRPHCRSVGSVSFPCRRCCVCLGDGRCRRFQCHRSGGGGRVCSPFFAVACVA